MASQLNRPPVVALRRFSCSDRRIGRAGVCGVSVGVGVLLAMMLMPIAWAQHIVDVECFEQDGECVETLNPNPLLINVGDQVRWRVSALCGFEPCSGLCDINVPPGPGFPGFFDIVNAGNLSNITPQFNQPGVFYYQLACSPVVIGTIIVGNPTMQLFINGPCPGSVTLTASDATAGGKVFFGYGFASGSTKVPGCPGLNVDIKNAKLAGARTANAQGVAELTGFAPAGVCGITSVQAVDKGSCRTSNISNL